MFHLDELAASFDATISGARQKAEATGYIFPKAKLEASSLQSRIPLMYVDDTVGIGFTDPFSGVHFEPSGKVYGPFPAGPPVIEFTMVYKTEPATEAEIQKYMDSLPKTCQNCNGCHLVDFHVSPNELTM